MYIYIYIHIRHRAARHAGRVRCSVCFSDVMFFCLKGLPKLVKISLRLPLKVFSRHFLLLFSCVYGIISDAKMGSLLSTTNCLLVF